MVTGASNQQSDDANSSKSPANSSKLPSGRSSWGTPAISGGQSASTSGSAGGSPSAVATPASENTVVRMNQLDIHGDDAGSSQPEAAVSGKKKKRGTRAVAGDKSGRGLRQFSMKVCEKVESKGRTTYNEVADELVAEFADPANAIAAPDQQQYDEKNIRRRVYDALNVLMAMDIISKDKKEIQWKGLPRTSLNDIEELKAERVSLKSRIDKKAAYLQELEDQYIGLQNLVHRNEQLYGDNPPGGVALPFILVQTRPHATVEVEISEDMQLVHFDFNSNRVKIVGYGQQKITFSGPLCNKHFTKKASSSDPACRHISTPFELHDDSYVLKAMRFCDKEQNDDAHEPSSNGGEIFSSQPMFPPQMPQPTRPSSLGKVPSSPPIPGILKARAVKHEL